MSGPSGVPKHRTFDPTPRHRTFDPTPNRRPVPRHRALLLALGTLAAPALAVLALTAFGAMRDEPETGLGSLPAAEGLQGSAAGAQQPGDKQGAGPAGDDEERDDDTELADADPEGDGNGSRGQPALADCGGDGPRAQSAKRRAAPSGPSARAAAGCGEDGPEREIDGDLAPGPGASTNPPVEDGPTQGPATEEDDEPAGSDDPGRSGDDSP